MNQQQLQAFIKHIKETADIYREFADIAKQEGLLHYEASRRGYVEALERVARLLETHTEGHPCQAFYQQWQEVEA